ncbi:MAG: hypothetical protein Q8P18_29605 [Pseudomonadota bacterium]|nr:hypothetical protein [Pseudomonadota bacterium]
MWLLLVSLACAPKRVAPDAPIVPVAAPAVVLAVPALLPIPVPAPPVAPAPAPLPVLSPAPAADARTFVNAWRVRHNAAVARLEAGDAQGALAEARAALALAPADLRFEPLLLVAVAASQAGEVPTELDALERLGDAADVPWGLYYNGSIDAASVGRVDLAHRFAQASLARGGDVTQVAPMAVRAALRVNALDAALVAGRLLPAEHAARAELVRALISSGRCPDAVRLTPGACP